MYPLNTSRAKQFLVLVLVRNRQFLRRKERDDLRAFRRQHHFLFDARGGDAVAGGTERLDREHHPCLELVRVLERIEPRDERTLVQAEAEAVAEVEPECRHLRRETDLGALREG